MGVVLACPSCFLGLLGFSVFLVRSAPACWGGGRVAGGSGVRGLVRPGVLLPSCWGAGRWLASFSWGWAWGASARARFLSCPVLAVVGSGGRVRGVRVARFPWWGRVAPGFFCCLLWWGFSGVVFFRPVLLVFSWFPVLVFVVLPGVGGLWGVSGWVRGCFFSGFCCTGPGLFGFGLGFVWRV